MDSSSFCTLDSAQEKGLSCVPQSYVIPSLHRPNLAPNYANIATIDLAALKNGSSTSRLNVIQELGDACRRFGFFQVSFFVLIYLIILIRLHTFFLVFEMCLHACKRHARYSSCMMLSTLQLMTPSPLI